MMLCVSFEIPRFCGRIIVGVVIFCALFWFLLYSNEIIYYQLYYDGHGNGWIDVCVLRWGWEEEGGRFFGCIILLLRLMTYINTFALKLTRLSWDVAYVPVTLSCL